MGEALAQLSEQVWADHHARWRVLAGSRPKLQSNPSKFDGTDAQGCCGSKLVQTCLTESGPKNGK